MDKITLEYRNPNDLIDYIRNPRKNDPHVDRMISSIQEFGVPLPILIKSNGEIIDGHLRAKAARKMQLAQVPVVIADHLSEQQIKAFRLLANRSVNWSEWDQELLRLEFEELSEYQFDLSLTGFDATEIDVFTKSVDFEEIKESSTKEIDVDSYELAHRCPRCGFEFNDDQET